MGSHLKKGTKGPKGAFFRIFHISVLLIFFKCTFLGQKSDPNPQKGSLARGPGEPKRNPFAHSGIGWLFTV